MHVLEKIPQHAFGHPPDRFQSVRGGDINQAGRIVIDGENYFVKFKIDAPPRFFETEALGLNLLRQANELRVPAVVHYASADNDRPAYLILEWIDQVQPSPAFASKFGQALAAMHRHTAPTFGIDMDHVVEGIPQPATQERTWAAYYRDERILPQIERARQLGRLNPRREAALRELADRIESLLVGLESVPSLLHGDLWGGNYMCAPGDVPVLYDPHAYYGERETEIAFAELFGGFPPDFYRAYQAAYPLDSGYEFRRPLHQLYHLLVHLNLFGESYGASVDAICRQYLSGAGSLPPY